MKTELYFGKTYVGSDKYFIYIDEEKKLIKYVNVENSKDVKYDKNKKIYDTFLSLYNKEKKVLKKRRITKSIITISLLAFLSFETVKFATDKDLNYKIKYLFSNDLETLNSKYINKALNENKTISDEFKDFFLKFLNYSLNGYENLDKKRCLEIVNNIRINDYSLVKKEHFIHAALYTLTSDHDVSCEYLIREFYEYYYYCDPTLNSYLFDAINISLSEKDIISIVNKGDIFYKDYLKNKYNINNRAANNIIEELKHLDKDEEYYKNYIRILYENNRLANKYLKNFDSYILSSNGLKSILVDRNPYKDINSIYVSESLTSKYKIYFDRYNEVDYSDIYYAQEFKKLISNFDGKIDSKNKGDRIILYTCVGYYYQSKKVDDPNLYFIAKSLLGTNLYSYFTSNKYNSGMFSLLISSDILDAYIINDNLTDEEIKLLYLLIECLREDLKDGFISEKEISIIETTYNVIVKDKNYYYDNYSDIIKKTLKVSN